MAAVKLVSDASPQQATAIGRCSQSVGDLIDRCLAHGLQAVLDGPDDPKANYRQRRANDYWCMACRLALASSGYQPNNRVLCFNADTADHLPAMEIAEQFVGSA